MKYVLATANPGKVHEMTHLLQGEGFEVVSRADLGIDVEIEETGVTFYDNALLKATGICNLTNLPAIADDSGIIVDALGGEPGVYTSSFGGDGLDDMGRCLYMLDRMKGISDRSARFVCVIVCAYPDGTIITAQGECIGEISHAPKGTNGHGYDPVFVVEGMGRTAAELTTDEKNAISHRGKALTQFVQILKERGDI